MLAIVIWQLTGDLLFLSLVSSVRVACLLAFCVLIGSLAILSFSFCLWSVLAFLQIVDSITGKMNSSMVIILALKAHCDTELLHGLVPRTRLSSGLLSLLYSTTSGYDFLPFAKGFSCKCPLGNCESSLSYSQKSLSSTFLHDINLR